MYVLLMQESFDDPHKTSESSVVHVRGLAETVVEADLIEAVQPFGNVGYVEAFSFLLPTHVFIEHSLEFECLTHANIAKSCPNHLKLSFPLCMDDFSVSLSTVRLCILLEIWELSIFFAGFHQT